MAHRSTRKFFSEHWTKRGIRHNKIVPRSPWMNGMVERRNKGVLKALTAAVQEEKDWRKALQEHLDYYNNVRPHSSTSATPFELMTGRLFKGIFPVAPSWSNISKFNHTTVKEIDMAAKQKSINHANDKNRAKESNIKASDWVWVKDWNRVNKLAPIYQNKKFQVIERLGPKVIIKSDDGQLLSRWVSALKKTSGNGKDIEVNDSVQLEKNSKTPSKISNHHYKVLAEEGDLITIRNDSGVTFTCSKEDTEKLTEHRWKDFTKEQSEECKVNSPGEIQPSQVPSSPPRHKRVVKEPAWQKDYKLFNVFG